MLVTWIVISNITFSWIIFLIFWDYFGWLLSIRYSLCRLLYNLFVSNSNHFIEDRWIHWPRIFIDETIESINSNFVSLSPLETHSEFRSIWRSRPFGDNLMALFFSINVEGPLQIRNSVSQSNLMIASIIDLSTTI